MSPPHVSTALVAACLRSMSSSTPFAVLSYWLRHRNHIVHLPGILPSPYPRRPLPVSSHSLALQSDTMILQNIPLRIGQDLTPAQNPHSAPRAYSHFPPDRPIPRQQPQDDSWRRYPESDRYSHLARSLHPGYRTAYRHVGQHIDRVRPARRESGGRDHSRWGGDEDG